MDLAHGYLASTTHERNVAAADRINAYRRRVGERRALEAASREKTSAEITSARADRFWLHGPDAALPSRP